MITRWSLLILVSTSVALGCNGPEDFPTVRVSGRVTVDDVAIDEGTIDFVPIGSQQGQSTTAEITAGSYEAKVVPGRSRVYIHATRETGRTVEMFDQPMAERENLIPEHYRQGIAVDVIGEDATQDFQLTQARP